VVAVEDIADRLDGFVRVHVCILAGFWKSQAFFRLF
jgi:hypothetical protein